MTFKLSEVHIAALQQQLKAMFINSSDSTTKEKAKKLEIDGTIDDNDGTKFLVDKWEKQNKNKNIEGFKKDGQINKQEAEYLGLFGFRTQKLAYNTADTGLLRAFLRGMKGGEKVAISGQYTEDLAKVEEEVKENLLENLPYSLRSRLSQEKRFTQNDIRILQKEWASLDDETRNKIANEKFKTEHIGTNTSGIILGVGIKQGFDASQNPDEQYKAVINKLRKTFNLKETGEYDEELAKKVKEFQKEYGLQVDGILGPQTESYLEHVTKKIKEKLDNDDGLTQYEKSLAENLGISEEEDFESDFIAARSQDFVFTTRSSRGVNLTQQPNGTLKSLNGTAITLSDNTVTNTTKEKGILELSDLTPSKLNQLIIGGEFGVERNDKNLILKFDDKQLTINDFYKNNGASITTDFRKEGFRVIRFKEENGVTQEMRIEDLINKIKPPIVFDPLKTSASVTTKNIKDGILILPSLSNRFEYNNFISDDQSPLVKSDNNLKISFGDKSLTIEGLYSETSENLNENLVDDRIKYIQLGDGTLISLEDFLAKRTI
ncbi:MAG: peptidoglycan-binding domain-containing protein [Candidatus Caenarcaniphilales bacterium]|nr:peptidoglycan-binding domain-containing protein [Candidatus Caenarcaniphilales bacterium]